MEETKTADRRDTNDGRNSKLSGWVTIQYARSKGLFKSR